jgi:hypothetical protein
MFKSLAKPVRKILYAVIAAVLASVVGFYLVYYLPKPGPRPVSLNPAEKALLTHIPSTFSQKCVHSKDQTSPEDIAILECRPSSTNIVVKYNQYTSAPARDAAFQREATPGSTPWAPSKKLPPATCDPIVDPSFAGIGLRPDPTTGSGQLACWVDKGGYPYVAWTNQPLNINAHASFKPKTIPQGADLPDFEKTLYQFQATAGPE